MKKSSRTTSSRKQSKHSSGYPDSETEIVDDEEREGGRRKTKTCKEESSVTVSHAGEKRKLEDGGGNRCLHENDSEVFADVEQISSKRRRESEKKNKNKNMKDEIADTERPSKEEVRNLKSKELEKLIRRSRDGSVQKGEYQECERDDTDRYMDGVGYKYKFRKSDNRDNRHADGASYTSKCGEVIDRDVRHTDGAGTKVKYGEAADRDSRHKDAASYASKHGEDADRGSRHKDGASCKVTGEAADKDAARYKAKYEEYADRDSKHKDAASYKVRYKEDADRDSRHKDAARYKGKYEEDADRDRKHKDAASYEVRYEEDADGDSRPRDSRTTEDFDCKKRHLEDRHHDKCPSRDHHSDRSGSKHAKDESYAIGIRYKRSRYDDGENPRYNDGRGSRGDDRMYHEYSTSQSTKKQNVDPGKNNVGYSIYNDGGDQTYSRSRSTKEQHFDPEKNDGGDTRYKDDRRNKADDREDQSRSSKERYVDPERNAGELIRYDDNKGSRADDREDRSRSQSIKAQHLYPEKKVSGMTEHVADEEGSHLHHADADLNASCNKQRNSPSSYSHLSKDQFRPSIQSELKYGEPDERVHINLLPSKEVADVSGALEQPCLSKHTKRLIDKDDSSFCDLSVERDLICDVSKPSNSPVDLPDDSKLIQSSGHNPDNNKFGRSSGVKDSGSSFAEGKGSWQLPSKNLPTGEKPQEDCDVFSSSSSINAGQVSSNSYSKFRQPHNHHKRANRPNAGSVHGNARKGLPNRPYPLVNNFTHFQHGPVSVGFNPLMHHYPAFPMYTARPLMDVNHPVFSHDVPNTGRYFSHGHQYGWRNPFDNGLYPPLPGQDANNVATRPEAPAHGTFDWNHKAELIGDQQMETSADMLNGSIGGVNVELPSVSHELKSAAYANEDETCLGLSWLQESQSDTHLDKGQKIEIGLDTVELAKEPCISKSIAEKLPKHSEMPKDEDGHFWLVYLSKLDISVELTHPELYNKCLTLKDVEPNENIDGDSLELLCLEKVVKTQVELPKLASSASLFVAVDDSVFQRAMFFYKKQREETRAITHALLIDEQKLDVQICDQENEVGPFSSSNELKQGQFFPACSAANRKVNASVLVLDMEKSCGSSPRQVDTSMILDVETVNGCIKDRSPTLHNASHSDHSRPGYLNRVRHFHSVGSTGENKSLDISSDHITVSSASGEEYENVMSKSVAPGSVSLSWTHDALEITR
ncbi:uncharacterized protein LOC126793355 [Argentina anserina]|uniref:uncharacterized protein LOC126793355 n=1 Tax=Argentina anserina TaxID=57926 RepID=UPI0021766FEF|nr:uncharacterized protein LOC126793355 [Potentilla anserina]